MVPVGLRPMAYCLNATLTELGVGWWAVVVVLVGPLVALGAAAALRRLARPGLVVGLVVAVLIQVFGTLSLVGGPANYPQAWRVWWWFFGCAAVCWFLAACLAADVAARGWGRQRPAGPRKPPAG